MIGQIARHIGFKSTVAFSLACFSAGAAAMAGDQDKSPREAPRVLSVRDAAVGRQVADLEFTDIDGVRGKLSDFKSSKALVVAVTSTSCPISKRYVPALARLEASYRERGVSLLLLNPIVSDAVADMREARANNKFQARYVHDQSGLLARSLGAKATADVFVLDASRTLVYRGALNDQYGLGYSLDAPRNKYVENALEAVLADRRPEVAATDAPGCALDLTRAAAPAAEAATYHARISRIVQSNCVECHRSGGVAPFSLESYDDVVSHSGMISKVVEKGTMPPWFAAAGAEKEPTPWANDRSLPTPDKTDLLAWLKTDKPLGNLADAPVPHKFPSVWQIGEPDTIVQIPEPIDVKAEGKMPYKNVFVKTEFSEDRWMQAYEILPTAREVVHHVLVFAIPKSQSDENGLRRASARGEGGGYFAAYVPGNSAIRFPDGFAKKLPAGATLQFQIHYTPNGAATQDQTRMAIRFSPETPRFAIHGAGVVNPVFNIPPETDNYKVSASLPVPFDAKLMAFMPHMHLRGKAFRYELASASGESQMLLDVPHYDFNWQLSYRLAEPLDVRAGSRIEATAWYDNSSANPANPDPKRTVKWGPQTDEEMMIGFVEYYVPSAGIGEAPPMRAGRGAIDVGTIFKQFDKNSDGKITSDELPKDSLVQRMVERLDTDKDGVITLEEAKLAIEKGGLGQERRPQP